MAKCPKCGKRKAKRFCPALGNNLCSLCCGQLREKDIDCSPDCSFLQKHRSYQESKEFEKAAAYPFPVSPEEDILRDERMAWLALHIEAPLKEASERNASFADRDALSALEYAFNKIKKGRSILLIDRADSGPYNQLGENIIQSMDRCRYEKKIILPDDHLSYNDDEKARCLERIILSVRYLARNRLSGRNYIESLLERFSQIQNLSRVNPTIALK